MLLFRLTLFVIAVSVTVDGTFQEDMDEAKKAEMYNCFFAILCKARKAEEFRRIMLKADENLIKKGFQWLKEISNIDGSDTPEFWKNYPDYKCPLPEETKHEYFVEWLKRLGEYWSEACMDQNSEACVKMAAAEHEYNVVTAEYTANGVCQSEAAEMGEKKMDEGKEAMGEGIGQSKDAMGSLANKGGGWGK